MQTPDIYKAHSLCVQLSLYPTAISLSIPLTDLITRCLCHSIQCSVVSNSLWPRNYSTPRFPVHHQLPENAQTHVHQVMPSNHLILCCPLLLLLSIFPSIRVFSNESALHIRWPKYRSFSFSKSPLGWIGLISLQSKGLLRVFSNTTVQKHQFFSIQLSLLSNSHIHTWLLGKP